jgi:predicted small metal-binding protein
LREDFHTLPERADLRKRTATRLFDIYTFRSVSKRNAFRHRIAFTAFSGPARRCLRADDPLKGDIMTRKYIDCREVPSDNNCSVALSADSDDELLEAAVQHAVSAHQHTDSPELRSQLKTFFHDGTPPVDTPRK